MLALFTFLIIAFLFYIGQGQEQEQLPATGKKETFVSEEDFWEKEITPMLQAKNILTDEASQTQRAKKKVNIQTLRKQQKDVKRRRKRRKLAKKSRQENRK